MFSASLDNPPKLDWSSCSVILDFFLDSRSEEGMRGRDLWKDGVVVVLEAEDMLDEANLDGL